MARLFSVLTLWLVACCDPIKTECDISSETVADGTYYQRREKLCPGDLIFEDDFKTDLARWQHEVTLSGGGNGEFQFYTNNRSNSYVEDGFLHIKPTYLSDDYGEDFLYSGTLDLKNECTDRHRYGCIRTGTATNIVNPIKSARIRTVESFFFKYGSVVVRAKMPSGDWLWPAIWLMPRYSVYGIWPASGEIDIQECRGNKNLINQEGVNVGTQQATSTLHWGPSTPHNRYTKTIFHKQNASGYDADFHLYKLVWNSSGLSFYIDDELTGTVPTPKGGFWKMGELENSGVPNPWINGSEIAPFDQQFYLIINLAIGGTNYFFYDGFINAGGKPWLNNSPTAMTDFWKGKSQWEPTWNLQTNDSHLIVDYVRVYAV